MSASPYRRRRGAIPQRGSRGGTGGNPRSNGRSAVRRSAAWLGRNSRLAVALLLCAAAAITVHQLTPAPAATAMALAAARDLPAGTALQVSDLARLKVPPDLMAGGFLRDPAQVAGKQLAAPVRKGQPLTDTVLLGPGLLAGTAPGSAAVPLRMADPASIQLVAPGQLVNVVLTPSDGFEPVGASEVLAKGVAVLWTSDKGSQDGQWLGTAETEGLLVVAADGPQAERLAGASTRGRLFFVLVGPP